METTEKLSVLADADCSTGDNNKYKFSVSPFRNVRANSHACLTIAALAIALPRFS